MPGDSGGEAGYGGGMMGGMMGGMGGMMGSMGMAGANTGVPSMDGRGPFDVPLEVRGVIYIFNPPDAAKLGTGTDDSSACV